MRSRCAGMGWQPGSSRFLLILGIRRIVRCSCTGTWFVRRMSLLLGMLFSRC